MTQLQQAVFDQSGADDVADFLEIMRDVRKGGADAGVHGFRYTRETCEFFTTNRLLIRASLSDTADSLGDTVIRMVAGFRCLNGEYTQDEVAEVLYNPALNEGDPYEAVANALAWFAIETVAIEMELESND